MNHRKKSLMLAWVAVSLLCQFSFAQDAPKDSADQVVPAVGDYCFPEPQPSHGLELQVEEPDHLSGSFAPHNKFSFGGEVTTFFRDAEYDMRFLPGYTAIGYIFTPHVKYLAWDDFLITLGGTFIGIAGEEGFWKVQPMVRLEHEFELRGKKQLRMVMGDIYSGSTVASSGFKTTYGHGLYEPMWHLERYFLNHTEQGLQFLGKMGRFTGDTWITWTNFIEPGDAEQETFYAGTSQRFWFTDPLSAGRWKIYMPFSFLGTHRGGQITSIDTNIQSQFNESVGLSLEYRLAPNYPIHWHAIGLDVPVFFYQNISPTVETRYSNGYGIYPHLTYQFKFEPMHKHGLRRLLAQAGYWQAYHYIAPMGSYLFQSVSWHHPEFEDEQRQMFTGKLIYEMTFTRAFSIGADVELYYDLHQSDMDEAFGIYMKAYF